MPYRMTPPDFDFDFFFFFVFSQEHKVEKSEDKREYKV